MQNEIYDKWKTTGSLLWIHGIRMCISFVSFATADSFLYGSWVRKECTLVYVATIIRLYLYLHY